MAPSEPPVSPDWSPVKQHGGYASSKGTSIAGVVPCEAMSPHDGKDSGADKAHRPALGELGLWSLGCDCFAYCDLRCWPGKIARPSAGRTWPSEVGLRLLRILDQ